MSTEFGVNYDEDRAKELRAHLNDNRIREWRIEIRCENCTYVKLGWARDSKSCIMKETVQWLCPECQGDHLIIYLKDLGPADPDKPCVSVSGKRWDSNGWKDGL